MVQDVIRTVCFRSLISFGQETYPIFENYFSTYLKLQFQKRYKCQHVGNILKSKFVSQL